MDVTIDASPLGIGFYHRQAKTGISRIVEKLVAGLHQRPDVRLTLAAPTHLSETMRYAAATFGKAAPPFVNRPGDQRRAALENSLLRPFAVGSLSSKLNYVAVPTYFMRIILIHTLVGSVPINS